MTRPAKPEFDPAAAETLKDLLSQAEAVERLVTRGKAAYSNDEMLRFAGEDLLIRCGEVVARLARTAPSFIDDNPELKLRNLKDARNVVAHGYDIVDSEIVWQILSVHIPRVARKVKDFLAEHSR
ncbi:MAG: DUF86 domain-containing protein [Ancrocorticia sp.]